MALRLTRATLIINTLSTEFPQTKAAPSLLSHRGGLRNLPDMGTLVLVQDHKIPLSSLRTGN